MTVIPIITLPNSPIQSLPFSVVESIELNFSIFSLFASGSITISDATKAYSNAIKIGDRVNIGLIYDNDDIYQDAQYILPFSVLSITRSGAEAMADTLTLNLVSAIYFASQTATLCHRGNVSSIINNIMNTTSYLNGTVSVLDKPMVDITETEDPPRYRYQTGETYPNFIGRIMKYAIKGDEPVYAYLDTKGIFCVKGIADFKSVEPQLVIAAPTVALKGKGVDKNMRRMEYYNGVLHMSDSFVSKIESIFCDDLFKSNSDRITSISTTDISGEGNSAKNPSVRNNFPGRVNYYGWHRTPEDTRSIASRNSFEALGLNYKFSATFEGWNNRDVALGNILYLLLPQTPTEVNSSGTEVNTGEGKYMVTDASFEYSNSLFTTNVTMVQTDC